MSDVPANTSTEAAVADVAESNVPVRWSPAVVLKGIAAIRMPLLVLLVFLTLAALLLGPVWTSPTSRTLGGGVGDPADFMWFLRWTPFAVGRQLSPFFTDHLNHPYGVNLMWNTWVPLPGLLLAPITLIWGPVLTINILLVLAFGLSSWSAYLAIRRYVSSHGAAVVGGVIYGFSPAMRGHSHHLNLILVFLLPLLLVLVDEILVRQRRSPVWLGVALGGVAGAQALVGEELLVATALLGAALLLVLMAMHPLAVIGRIRFAVIAFGVAAVIFGAVVAWPFKVQLTGPARVRSDITLEARGFSDVLATMTPNRQQAIDPPAARLGDRFPGSGETYLGVPLLLAVFVVAVARRSRPVVRVAFAMFLVSLVLSFGRQLRVAGHATGLPLPWAAMERLPLVQHMVPSRLAFFTALFAGLLLAVALQELWQGGGWWRRSAAVATAALVLAFISPPGPLASSSVKVPAFFATSAVRTLPRDDVALVIPFPRKGTRNEAMLWQAEAGMWFKMPGGYFTWTDPAGSTRREATPTTTSVILARIQRGVRPPALTPALRSAIARDFANWRVRSVLLGPMDHHGAMADFLTELLGRPPETVEDVKLWRNVILEPPTG
jgi:hypothetical protein